MARRQFARVKRQSGALESFLTLDCADEAAFWTRVCAQVAGWASGRLGVGIIRREGLKGIASVGLGPMLLWAFGSLPADLVYIETDLFGVKGASACWRRASRCPEHASGLSRFEPSVSLLDSTSSETSCNAMPPTRSWRVSRTDLFQIKHWRKSRNTPGYIGVFRD